MNRMRFSRMMIAYLRRVVGFRQDGSIVVLHPLMLCRIFSANKVCLGLSLGCNIGDRVAGVDRSQRSQSGCSISSFDKIRKVTNEEIVLVKRSWRAMRDFNPLIVGDSFYSKLFSKKTSLRKMFPGEMEHHYKELVGLLQLIIARLDQSCLLTEQLELLARRHVHYAITGSQYKLIEEAMLWTVERALGKDCNNEVLAAWKNCYVSIVEKTIVASEMIAK